MSAPAPIEMLTVRQLLQAEADYLVPMYQRNYAWEEAEISQLILDILDGIRPGQRDGPLEHYYMGTLVVHVHASAGARPVFELIDGQQRFTTLTLMAAWLKHQGVGELREYKQPNLRFECREVSTRALEQVFAGGHASRPDNANRVDAAGSSAVRQGYALIGKLLPRLCKEYRVGLDAFAGHLLDRVLLLRAPVPEHMDVNHYFEVMNSRGEQLEKHEVLKARLLDKLKHKSHGTLHRLWEACASMDRHVQTAFTPLERTLLFGEDWSTLRATSFDAIEALLTKAGSRPLERADDQGAGLGKSLEELTQLSQEPDKDVAEDEEPRRFHSVINFPNFLLQVLCVTRFRVSMAPEGADGDFGIPLDDKRLLETFDAVLLQGGAEDTLEEEVKRFAFQLLQCRHLLDQHVIKREITPGEDDWSLKRYRKQSRENKASYVNAFGDDERDDLQRKILMLQAAFHVSTPTQSYKYWLNAVLDWLHRQSGPVGAADFLRHMESVARAFVFDRFLAKERASYSQIIYREKGRCRTQLHEALREEIRPRLRYAAIENNLVFNYLDFLLWLRARSTDREVADFRFKFRSSVEHMHPQQPLDALEKWEKEDLNCFGNLCLISHEKNSRLSNLPPLAKSSHYKAGGIDSVKQHLMFKEIEKAGRWRIESMRAHESDMLNVLAGALERGLLP